MADKIKTDHEIAPHAPGVDGELCPVKAWFVHEVLPLEAALMQFLRRSGRSEADIADLRQEVYLRVCQQAEKEIPHPVKPLVFTIARNLLIDQVRRGQVIPIESVADLEAINVAGDTPGPDRTLMAREELLLLRAALEKLPPRCREALILRRIEGLSRREIAERMGISEHTVSEHINAGVRALANALYGEPAQARRPQ
ncbi:MAG TPA: RNA polymerase sigma factor [Rhizomicrobium sp.]|nr:RNA polymerase sigma factor [Rhizomicrobium sp.]